MAANKTSVIPTAPICFKNKHRLNEDVLPPLCLPCIPDTYISVSNRPTPSTVSRLPSGPNVESMSVCNWKATLVVADLISVTPRCICALFEYKYASAEQCRVRVWVY